MIIFIKIIQFCNHGSTHDYYYYSVIPIKFKTDHNVNRVVETHQFLWYICALS